MAELELIEDRIVSGRGLLRVPSSVENTRYLRLNIDVIRQVPEPFESFKWSPTRSRYCTLAFMRDGYVTQEEPVDYERRQFEFLADSPGQTLIAVKCAYKGLLETFVNLGNALNLAPFIIANNIEDYENLRLLWDEVQIVCEGSTAVQVRLFALEYDDNCESSDEKKLPPPPSPLPRINSNESIGSISRPYDRNDTVTRPNPLDEFEPPPTEGEQCEQYVVTFTATRPPNSNLNFQRTIWGEYDPESARFESNPGDNSGARFFFACRGLTSADCGDFGDKEVNQISQGNFTSVSVVSIVPVP